jgi:hypothetical protein
MAATINIEINMQSTPNLSVASHHFPPLSLPSFFLLAYPSPLKVVGGSIGISMYAVCNQKVFGRTKCILVEK